MRQFRYLETITNILVLINSQVDTDDEKRLFWRILSSQLTGHEMTYLFYQCLISEADHPLRVEMHSSGILVDRAKSIGIPLIHRIVYKKYTGTAVPEKKFSPNLPFDKKIIRKIRKARKRREQEQKQEVSVSTLLEDDSTVL
jgi:hypothetical protein